MINDILAQASQAYNWPMIVSASVISLGLFGLTIKHVTNGGIHLNGKNFIGRELYDADQTHIKESLTRIETTLAKITVIKLAEDE